MLCLKKIDEVFLIYDIFFLLKRVEIPLQKKKERKKGERLIKLFAQLMGKYIISDTQIVDSVN